MAAPIQPDVPVLDLTARFELRAARIARRISIRSLARRAKVSPMTIANVENGRQRVSADILTRLCGILGLEWRQPPVVISPSPTFTPLALSGNSDLPRPVRTVPDPEPGNHEHREARDDHEQQEHEQLHLQPQTVALGKHQDNHEHHEQKTS